ncbi:unnamed protein product [Phytomonas sp. EM1]|nr:unnamed protein product [Phytomonas sp. EM1]|eukprot:CCW65578.1 unnamed protein product [Phytomonas sp. isolate EM1]
MCLKAKIAALNTCNGSHQEHKRTTEGSSMYVCIHLCVGKRGKPICSECSKTIEKTAVGII